jgi:hypothetical protein
MSKESAAGDRPAPGQGAGAPGAGEGSRPPAAPESKSKNEYKSGGGCLQLLIIVGVVLGVLIGAVLVFGDFAK